MIECSKMNIILLITCVFYAFATYFRAKEKIDGASMKLHSRWSLGFGFVCHLALCVISFDSIIEFKTLPIKSIFMLGSLLLALITTAIELKTKESYFSIFSLPLCIAIILTSSFASGGLNGNQFDNPFFFAHITASIAGECFFLIAAISSVSYLYVVRRLKQKNRIKAVLVMPPLARLDQLTWKLILYGVITFSIGLILGIYQSYADFGFFKLTLKHGMALVVLIFYTSIVILKKPLNLAGLNQAKLAIIGLVLSLFLIIYPNNSSHWFPVENKQNKLVKIAK